MFQICHGSFLVVISTFSEKKKQKQNQKKKWKQNINSQQKMLNIKNLQRKAVMLSIKSQTILSIDCRRHTMIVVFVTYFWIYFVLEWFGCSLNVFNDGNLLVLHVLYIKRFSIKHNIYWQFYHLQKFTLCVKCLKSSF